MSLWTAHADTGRHWCIVWGQVWDINEPAPAALEGAFGLITAANAVHTCLDLSSAWPELILRCP